MIKNYRDLDVWHKSMDLVVNCYNVTKLFPKHELYGLTSQLQRAAVSVPANIAEGRQRQHRKEFRQFLSIAQGSLAELETHLEIAVRLGYTDTKHTTKINEQTQRVSRMLHGLKIALAEKR